MAAISRIIALPSATEYNPYPPTLDQIVYSGNYLETPSVRIDFSYPSQSWKNKPPFAYISPNYREIVKRDSDGVIINDSPAFEGAGFTSQYMTAGTLCNYQSYTLSNGSVVYSPVGYFTAQTRPDAPTAINLFSANYVEIKVTWDDLSMESKWGGAPSSDRQWYVDLQRWNPGYSSVMNATLGYAARSYTFGGNFSGYYRVILLSKTKAGFSATQVSTQQIDLDFPSEPGRTCTSFDYFDFNCPVIGCCGPMYLTGSPCNPQNCS
jgi:hypothetical protein